MGQGIPIGMPQEVLGLRASRKISALVCCIAPSAIGIPVPGRNRQLRVLPISNRSPSRRKRLFQDRRAVDRVDRFIGEQVLDLFVGVFERVLFLQRLEPVDVKVLDGDKAGVGWRRTASAA